VYEPFLADSIYTHGGLLVRVLFSIHS
jgi:hypothetical protein